MITERATEQQIKLYYDFYLPDAPATKARPLLIALHGYEGTKESMMALALKINRNDFAITSIQGPNSFFVRGDNPENTRVGFGWMMRYKAEETIRLHHRTVISVIEAACATTEIDRNAIFLLAFSQSVALNYRFAFMHPGLIKGIVAVCGGIPGDWDEDKYRNSETDVLIIAGETDEFYPLERTSTFQHAITRRARSVEFRTFPAGHVFPRESLPVINDWLLERIQS